MQYEITQKNWGGYEVFKEIVTAENENAAIQKIIDNLSFVTGDTLTIEEVE